MKISKSLTRIRSGPLTEEERQEFYRILNDSEAFDAVVERALEGWRRGRAWKKRIKRS
jgi:ferric-dicitrate binding protein FerR (iron transport regulator)